MVAPGSMWVEIQIEAVRQEPAAEPQAAGG